MNRRSHLVLLALSLSLAAAGCGVTQRAGSDPATAPEPASVVRASEASAVATPAITSASAPAATTNGLLPVGGIVRGVIGDVIEPVGQELTFLTDPNVTPVAGDLVYNPLVVSLVLPGLESTVQAGRWKLDFHLGSLLLPKPISISQASDGTMRVQLGPDGTHFGTPVDVTIRYDGTSADPASPNWVPGTQPTFLWWDPAHSVWVEMPSTNDRAHKVLHAKLQHFSTYGVGGKAGW